MSSLSTLWQSLTATPLFGLTATLLVYVAAQTLHSRAAQAPWANPVVWSVMTLATVLTVTSTPYATYFASAQFIHALLGPAVVALAWPLWRRRAALRSHGWRFAVAAVIGGVAAAASAAGLAWAFDLPTDIVLSLAPKSVTAPVAMGVAEKIGGIPALAAVFAVLTGMVGAISGKYLFDALGIGTDGPGWMARGFALGTTSHGIGAARALQTHPDAGAWAGLALGLQVVVASLLIPLVARLL
jgi:predicted murein hydrolase (TIGR00659 family)